MNPYVGVYQIPYDAGAAPPANKRRYTLTTLGVGLLRAVLALIR